MEPLSSHAQLRRAALLGREQLYQEFHTSETGLSAHSHDRRAETSQKTAQHLGVRFCRAFFTPFNLILLGLALVSWLTNAVWPSNETKTGMSAVLIGVVLLASVLLRLWQERKAGHAADSFFAGFQGSVCVRRGKETLQIDARQLCLCAIKK